MPDTAKVPAGELADFLESHPRVKTIDALFEDLSGIVRGKRLPVAQAAKLFGPGAAMPRSVFLLSVTGDSFDPEGRGFSDGDPDGIVKALPGSLVEVPWSERPLGQVLITFEEDGRPNPIEPRNVLARTLARFDELGLRPVVAFELEFYLIDIERAEGEAPQPPRSPVTGQRDRSTQVYGMATVDDFGGFLDDVVAACTAQGVETGAVTSEYAPGQFEINLQHQDDPLRAADHCVVFKRAVKGVARNHGVQATFMAKPYPEASGSGLHLHISLLDKDGRNVFDGGDQPASPRLRQAIAGILDLMPDAMGILAPNPNSYRRYQPNIYVPVNRSWGFENRSVALRIPIGDGASRRIEHRIAGADANPYLTLATALAGIHHGLTNQLDPGPPWEGNAGEKLDPEVPFRPWRALDRLAESQVMADYLGEEFRRCYVACKRLDLEQFEAEISPAEYRWYLLAE
ncbi:MAG: glutamine synthetase family protein [Pseudomonadota bacterium]